MDIQYRPAAKADCADILHVTDKCINDEQAYHAYIEELCGRLDKGVAGVVALLNGKTVGVALCIKGMELTGERTDFFEKIKGDIGAEEIWSGCVIAVTEELQNMHIGAEMQKRCLSVIRKQGGRHLLLEIWVHPDGTEPGWGNLKHAPSYTDYGVVPDFYNIPALAGHECRICGAPCHCGARIAVLHLFPKIEYRPATKADFEAVMQLCANYIDPSAAYSEYMGYIHDVLGRESAEVLAFCENRLVGLMNTKSGMHLTEGRQDFFDEIRHDVGDGVIWSAGFITVDPEFQGYSIAKELFVNMHAELKRKGVGYMLTEVWCRPDGYMPSRFLAQHFCESVKEYGIVENFYADIPRPEGTECQVCGKDCRCKALIAVAKL